MSSAERSWYAWKHYNAASADVPQASYFGGYARGYRDALADSVEFNGLQASIDRLANLLEDRRVEREAVRSVADDLAGPFERLGRT
jgi:hypothetical protein